MNVSTHNPATQEASCLLIGTHYHPGGEEGLRRQRESRATLLELRGVHRVNLQFPDAVIAVDGFETLAELQNDSVKASGCQGPRKPVLDEAFQRLAARAQALGLPWFAWVNADIQVTQEAVGRVLASGLEAVVLSRMDFDRRTGRNRGVFLGGQDAFFFRTEWWRANHALFRPYVAGEPFFDNVFTAILLSRARAELWHWEPLIRHEAHTRLWRNSPFQMYNRRLAAHDSLYLEQWNHFKELVCAARERQADVAEQRILQQRCFGWPPPLSRRVKHGLRKVRLVLRIELPPLPEDEVLVAGASHDTAILPTGADELPRLLIGTHYHPGGEDSLRRQRESRATLLELRGVHRVNLQFPDAVIAVDGFETVPELHNDSVKASGCQGPRKPIGNEAFHRLAGRARALGLPWFAWVNADIRVTQEAVGRVLASGLEAVVLSRMDFDGPSGRDKGVFLGGQDAFFFRTDWWLRHHELFRPYVNSEAYWDNIYTAILLSRARAELWHWEPLIRHETHGRLWRDSPFQMYNRRLAAYDSLYLEQWNRFKELICSVVERKADVAEQRVLQQRCFGWPPPLSRRIKHVLRRIRLALGGKLPPLPE
jgi:hypothetical protein